MSEADAFEFHEFNVLVRDLDPQGHVANHIYVAYLSEARARFMRAFDGEELGFRPSVVAEMRCRYRSPLLPWERFRVGVRIARVGRTSVGFAYRVEADDGRLVADGDSVEVLIDPATRRPREIPAAARDRIAARFGMIGEGSDVAASAEERTRQDGIAPRP